MRTQDSIKTCDVSEGRAMLAGRPWTLCWRTFHIRWEPYGWTGVGPVTSNWQIGAYSWRDPFADFCRYGHGDNVPVPPLSLWHSYTRAGTLLRYEDILHQNLSSSFPVAVSTPQTLPSVILLVWSNR